MSVQEIKEALDSNDKLKELMRVVLSMTPEQREKAVPVLLEFVGTLKS